MWLIPLGLAGVFKAQKKSCSSDSARSCRRGAERERDDDEARGRGSSEGAWEA